MTMEEVIKNLELAKSEVEGEYTLEYATAIDEAIKAVEKLSNYEDMEKSCKFLKLPCKVGEKFYLITIFDEVKEATCTGYRFIYDLGFCAVFEYGDFNSTLLPFYKFSERVFGTQTLAKQALAEMQKEEVQNGE